MKVKIRSEQNKEADLIESVIVSAFLNAPHTGHNEHLIVNKLREVDALTISMVAEYEGNVIGHVAVSPVTISDGTNNWFGLGPISVLPEQQGNGVGSVLMKRALDELRSSGAAGCVLLGDPHFYSRFGFKNEPSLILPNVPQEYFQAKAFSKQMPNGEVSYHSAFQLS